MIHYKDWMKQTIDVPLSQYNFETILMHFKLAVAKQFVSAINKWMFVMFDWEYDTTPIKLKYIAWETLNKATQIVQTPEELYLFRTEYRKLMKNN